MATSNPGIRISQAGVSVNYAADYQLIFNSDWPSLQIAFEANLTIAAGGSGQVTHGLGFFPMTMAWFMVGGVSVGRFYGKTYFDKDNVYIDNAYNPSVVVSIKCYNLDVSKERNYELPRFPILKREYDTQTGIKVSKHGKSIESKDLRDFILHSRCQSPALLSVITQQSETLINGFGSFSYTNPSGYAPWVLGFISPYGDNTKYQCFPPGGQQSAPAFFQLGATSNVWTNSTGGNGTIVTLRDPLVVSNSLRVVY